MIVKGIVSAVNTADTTAEIILSEFDNQVTMPLPFYGIDSISQMEANYLIGKTVLVEFFNDNYEDGCILYNKNEVLIGTLKSVAGVVTVRLYGDDTQPLPTTWGREITTEDVGKTVCVAVNRNDLSDAVIL